MGMLPQTRDTIDTLIWCGLQRKDFTVSSPFDNSVKGYLETYVSFTRQCTLDKQLDVAIPLSKYFKVVVYWYESDIKRVQVLVEKPGLEVSILDALQDEISETSIVEDVREHLVERYQAVVARKLAVLSNMCKECNKR